MSYGSVIKDGFYARTAELGGTVIDKWKGSHTPHHVVCASGHDCYPNPSNVYRGKGGICLTCAGQDSRIAWEKFKASIIAQGGRVIEIKWLGDGKPHRVICRYGHNCAPTPNNVNGHQINICATCANRDSVASWEKFKVSIIAQGGHVIETKWLGNKIPHRVMCRYGHESSSIPNNITSGQGMCRVCKGKDWDVFYIVRGVDSIKFGITSRDGRDRISDHALSGFTTIIRIITNLPDGIAKAMEDCCLIMLRGRGFTPVRGREYFDASALPTVLEVADRWGYLGTRVSLPNRYTSHRLPLPIGFPIRVYWSHKHDRSASPDNAIRD